MATKVLLISLGFKPNIGGLETHLDDLVHEGEKNSVDFIILTYQPLTVKIRAPYYEKKANYTVIRLPVFGKLFYSLINKPILELLYLLPGIFLIIPFILITNTTVKTIHSHGLITGIAALPWAKLFHKKLIATTHSNYGFVPNSSFAKVSSLLFKNCSIVLCLSEYSKKEILSLGVNKDRVKVFTYWVDLDNFTPIRDAQKVLDYKGFNILFVGRLIEEKGILVLAEACSRISPKISVLVAGSGPLQKKLGEYNRIKLLGPMSAQKLACIYSAAKITIVPSIHEEGFGRVIIESLACGTPVIASNRGGIKEALPESCGVLIDVTKESIAKIVNYLYDHPRKLKSMQKKCRAFAIKNYSKSNAKKIFSEY